MYIRITEDGVQYPYYLTSLSMDFPDTSFPAEPSDGVLREFGVHRVLSQSFTVQPDVDEVLEELEPYCVNGLYYQSSGVRKMTAEESTKNAEAAMAYAKAQRAEAVRNIVVTTSTGKSFDGNEDAQNRMSRSSQLLTDEDELPWVLADATVANVTKAELTEALRLSGLAMAQIWVSIYK